jgi:Ca2+-binding EF-hand superfamily protein
MLALGACSLFSGPPKPSHWSPYDKPRDENWHSQTSSLLRYDANHDGTLTRKELLDGLHAEFNTYDVNRNNCLGADQVRAINQLRVQQDGSQATPLVDWNQDNCIDFNEFSATLLSLFDTLDKNGDGELSPQELRAAGVVAPAQSPDGQTQGRRGGHHHGGGGQ